MERELEQQFQQGVEFRRSGGARRHRGFGFTEEQQLPTAGKPDLYLSDSIVFMCNFCSRKFTEPTSSADVQDRPPTEPTM